jgi:lipopolysaccharide/colanic/teichoic acid biosynthesis glycosyltransferase
MPEIKKIATQEKWDISSGDYKSSNDYSKGQNQIRKKAKLVKRIILFVTVLISFLVFIIALSLLTKFNAIK